MNLKEETTPTATEILSKILNDLALPYTVSAAAAAKVQLSLEETQRIASMTNRIDKMQINKMKPLFRQPDLLHLKHKLATLDTSTNTYIHTTSHMVPLNNKPYHKKLGLITQPHPDMKDSMELAEFQCGTTSHRHIRSWKQRLRRTIIISVNDELKRNDEDIIIAVENAERAQQKNITIVSGLLVQFAMIGEGVPTLQADQLNVIAHHLHEINTKEDLWPNKEEWSHLTDSPKILPIQMTVNKLRRKTLKETLEWYSFLKSEHKQLNRYKMADMFGTPVPIEDWMTVLPGVWTYLYKEDPITAIEQAKA